jgi:hypothetical protein
MQNPLARFLLLHQLVQKRRKPAKNLPLVLLEWPNALRIFAVMRTHFQLAIADL